MAASVSILREVCSSGVARDVNAMGLSGSFLGVRYEDAD